MNEFVKGYLLGFLDGREAMDAVNCLTTGQVGMDILKAIEDFKLEK